VKLSRILVASSLLAVALGGPARAQMPDLRQMMGKPLPMADMPAGTIIVRVSDRLPMNGVAGVEVKATIVDAGGKRQMRTAKTGADGRATFEGLPQGARFSAVATAKGETLATSEFPVPAQGGARVLLIAGVEAAAAEAAGGGEADGQGEAGESDRSAVAFDAMLGSALPETSLPAGALEVSVASTAGAPLAGVEVTLGRISNGGELHAERAKTDDKGVARFSGLPTGEQHGFIALAKIDGLRLSTQPFRMPDQMGLRAQLRGLETTSDPTALRAGEGSQFIFMPRDEALVVWEAHALENTTNKLFVSGEGGGLFFPLPEGAQDAQALRESAPLEVLDGGKGLRFTGRVSPSGPGAQRTQAVFAFGLLSGGSETLTFRQKLPLGMQRPIVVTPAESRLAVTGDGVHAQPPRDNGSGMKIVVYELPPVPPGGTLELTVTGIPAHPRGKQALAAALAVALLIAGLLAARRPKQAVAAAKAKEDLVRQREELFAALVAHEKERPADANGAWGTRRAELVGKLEGVYRALAAREGREAGSGREATP
jgi:5-hydroxyisourate hydrolase-like protein (transthyretin family)